MLKVLGPTAEYLGGELKGISQNAVENVGRIIKAAVAKGAASDDGKGVPARVIHRILEEGIFCEDELMADYLGGVLASSKTSNLRDDRATSWVNALSRLTTYQIRAHYLAYWSLRNALLTPIEISNISQNIQAIRNSGKSLIVSKARFFEALQLDQGESAEDMMEHLAQGLKREELLSSITYLESGNELKIVPTVTGVSLLLWANGFGKSTPVENFTCARLTAC